MENPDNTQEVKAERVLTYFFSYSVIFGVGENPTPGWCMYDNDKEIESQEDIEDMILDTQIAIAQKTGRMGIVNPISWRLMI